MTQVFQEDGTLIPVTVLEAGPCVVTQIKTIENDGYEAVQVGYGEAKERITTVDKNGKKEVAHRHGVGKAMKGHFDKAGVSVKKHVREFLFENASEYKLGDEIKGMPGHMGSVQVTVRNLEIVRVDAEKNLLLVKGAIPGPKKGLVTIKETTKADA